MVATVAPVLMSVAIYLVTKSPFALLFAGLGPIMAIGTLVDGRFVRRRRARAELARFEAELASAKDEILAAHAEERYDFERESPAAMRLATARGREAVRWSSADPQETRVRLGRGEVPSRVTVDGAGGQRGDDPASRQLRALRAEAESIPDAAVTIRAEGGIGIVGPVVVAEALARAITLQLAATLSPARWTAVVPSVSWLRGGPHRTTEGVSGIVTFRSIERATRDAVDILVAVAAAEHELPAHLGTVIDVRGVRATVLRTGGQHAGGQHAGGQHAGGQHSGAQPPTTFVPELLSAELAAAWAAVAGALAVADGLVTSTGAIPDAVRFIDLPALHLPSDGLQTASRTGLHCLIGRSARGFEAIDLVADGPHAIVGGTTGSGKSELLVSWLLSMARDYSPTDVGFLLFDFKGGASFGEITALPHTVGLVTDLDAAGAARAIASLGAELRHRERLVAEARARSIGELPASTRPGRLVVVVDEFAALASDFPALNTQFGDLAARGRSLGIHLIVCTQRPVGVIRDAVLANTALRISLRVNNRPDSTAVIGSDDAATTGTPPGRAWISRDSGTPVAIQVAQTSPMDVAAVVDAWCGFALPRRPWLDPLPSQLDPATVPPQAFGLLDQPAEQRQEPAVWLPQEHGNVLVLGAGRSGKSTALAAMAAAAASTRDPGIGVVVVPSDIEGAWDALVALVDEASPRVVVIDDADALLTSFGQDYERSVIELIGLLLRGTGRARHRLVLAAQRLSAPLQQLAALCDSRLLLRLSNRQEHLLAGGTPETFIADLVPGGGFWRGARVQVAAVDVPPPLPREATRLLAPTGLMIAVSPRPAAFAERCEAAGLHCVELGTPAEGSALRYEDAPGALLLVASPDGWQAHWNGLSALRARFPLIVEGGSLAEFRSMSRLRQLPPPLADESRSAWLVEPSGVVRRVLLPQSAVFR